MPIALSRTMNALSWSCPEAAEAGRGGRQLPEAIAAEVANVVRDKNERIEPQQ